MNTVIQKWGNSQGIRIPKVILDETGFSENDRVEIIADNNSIILKKLNKKEHMTLSDRLEAFYKMPIDKIDSIEQYDEIDTGNAVGEEVW